MASYGLDWCAFTALFDGIVIDAGKDRLPARRRRARSEEAAVRFGQDVGRLIGRTADHRAVDVQQVCFYLVERQNSAIDDDFQIRSLLLQAIDIFIVQRRYLPVFLRRQAVQDGLAGVHDKGPTARSAHPLDKGL